MRRHLHRVVALRRALICYPGTLAVMATFNAAALAQDQPELVDRIVAIVGDSAVLLSEIQEQIFRLQAQGAPVPSDPAQLDLFMERVLEQKINEILVAIHARRAGITVLESEVNEAVDQRLAQIRRQFQSEREFQQALEQAGITPAEFRIQLTENARAELMTQRYLQRRLPELPPTPVTQEEIRQSFELQKRALGPKPASVSLKQVLIGPQSSDDARLVAREEAEQALSRLRTGEDFDKLAREYSDDAATRAAGGELGWLRRGQLLEEFDDALFGLREGQVSGIVETPLGFHIIKLERVRGAERFARHILITPEITPDDTLGARELAEEVATALRAGADPDSLNRAYGDPREQSTLTNFPQDQLPQQYAEALQGASEGDVIGPFKISTPALPEGKWVVIKLLALSPGGEWTLADVRDTIRQQLEQQKMIELLVNELRESTFVEVRL